MKEDPEPAKLRGFHDEHLGSRIMADIWDLVRADPFTMIFFDDEGGLDDYRKTMRTVEERLAGVEYAVVPGLLRLQPRRKGQGLLRRRHYLSSIVAPAPLLTRTYENWTERLQFRLADPRIIENHQDRDHHLRELRELSLHSASVLHRRRSSPCAARYPDQYPHLQQASGRGHMDRPVPPRSRAMSVTGIAGGKDFCAVLITKGPDEFEIGFGRKILQARRQPFLSILALRHRYHDHCHPRGQGLSRKTEGHPPSTAQPSLTRLRSGPTSLIAVEAWQEIHALVPAGGFFRTRPRLHPTSA